MRVSMKDGGALFKPGTLGFPPTKAGPARQRGTPAKQAPTVYSTSEEAMNVLERWLGPKSAWWTYTDAADTPVCVVVRFPVPPDPEKPDAKPGKVFRPVTWNGSAWFIGSKPDARPLYRLPDLLATKPGDRVFIVEGEKSADVARAVGLLATTSPHGSKSAGKADWSPVAGRDVVIVPDHDDAGEQYARDVARLATDAGAKSVRIVRLVKLWAGMPGGGDIVDYVGNRGGDAEVVRAEIEALTAATPIESTLDSSRSLRSIGERNVFTVTPITELGEPEPVDWLWPGYLARGSITLLTGLWKAGKTTLLTYLFRDLFRGGGLVEAPIDVPILLLSEESDSMWRERCARLNLSAFIFLVKRTEYTRPKEHDWIAQVEQLNALVDEHGAGVVVIDTLPSFWPVLNENDASEVIDALTPLRGLTEKGVAVLLIMHPRKGDGEQATATRGSGALPGFVDTIVELRRHDQQSSTDTRRTLKAFGRFPDTPAEAVIELKDDGYINLGGVVGVRREDLDQTIRATLNDAGMTYEEVRDGWPTEPKPGETTLRAALNLGASKGLWTRTGEGRRGDPFRFSAVTDEGADSLRSPRLHSERNEMKADPNGRGEGAL